MFDDRERKICVKAVLVVNVGSMERGGGCYTGQGTSNENVTRRVSVWSILSSVGALIVCICFLHVPLPCRPHK